MGDVSQQGVHSGVMAGCTRAESHSQPVATFLEVLILLLLKLGDEELNAIVRAVFGSVFTEQGRPIVHERSVPEALCFEATLRGKDYGSSVGRVREHRRFLGQRPSSP